jgi:hypothetical protein
MPKAQVAKEERFYLSPLNIRTEQQVLKEVNEEMLAPRRAVNGKFVRTVEVKKDFQLVAMLWRSRHQSDVAFNLWVGVNGRPLRLMSRKEIERKINSLTWLVAA